MKARLRGALLAVIVLGSGSAKAHAQVDLEQKVKAAFLFNFLKFVTWPPGRAPADGGTYVMCVLDDERFARTLAQSIRDKTVSGHPVQVQDRATGASLRDCHLAYLAPGPTMQATEAVFAGASGAGILTIHEADAAVPSGVIRLFLDQQRVRFEINTVAAQHENLHVSSRLMELAERVQASTPP